MTTPDNCPASARASYVARWLEHRFADHPFWTMDELEMTAKHVGISLWLYWESPPVVALGLRRIRVKPDWPNGPGWMYTKPEPEPETPNEETDTP